jgi:hypothetical protein
MSRRWCGAAAVVAIAIAVELWASWVHRRASRRGFPAAAPGATGGRTVVVLGFANRASRPNAVNRWRVRVALRDRPDRLVTCGGPVGGRVPEGRLLAEQARRTGYDGPIDVEDRSRTTWENIAFAIPYLELAGEIVIASNALHAEKAREYLRRQRPDLAERLVPGDEERFGELLWIKPAMAVVGLAKLRALRRAATSR